MNVYTILENSAAKWPDLPAVIDEFGILDYKTLYRDVEKVRTSLHENGVLKGQGIGIRCPNSRAFIISAFAALGSGATVMPISHLMKRSEFETLLDTAPLHAILSHDENFFSEQSTHINIPQAGPMHLHQTGFSRDIPLVKDIPDAAFVRFTSGTTGASKGVILTHSSVLERTAAPNRGLGLGPGDKVICVLPMAFHFFVSIVLYLEFGAAIIICKDHMPETILETAKKHSATLLYGSPLQYRMLAAFESGEKNLHTLKRAVSTSTGLSAEIANDFYRRYSLPVTQAYGIIEIGLPLMNTLDSRAKVESVGAPLPDYEVAVFDKNRKPLANGEIGELAIRGPGMFSGYLDPPQLRDDILHNGWFLTGDLALREPDGMITIRGRSKSMINVAGEKVFPEEVERVLTLHPEIEEARVRGTPHPRMGETIQADVVLRQGASVTKDSLLRFSRHHLSAFKVPQKIRFVSEVKKTTSGKLFR